MSKLHRYPVARRGAPLPILSLMLMVAAGADRARAQDRPALQAHSVQDAITVDGRLDEEAWQRAEPASGFRQFEPAEGDSATQRTEVRVLYGPRSLYVGAVLHDTDPAAIEQTLGRRDEFNRADWFVVSLDSYLDRRTAYAFGVNAAGVQFDAIQTGADGGGGPGGGEGGGGPTPPGMDPSWDAVWSSSVQATAEGWVVELSIPYSMLRFPDADAQTWGIHFMRRIPRLGEQSEWPLVPRSARSNLVARFGLLTGISGVEPRRNLQITPYSLAGLRTRERLDQPGRTAADSEIDVGGDVKVGLGPNVTLDATINPDFGQVESDPAVLNLTAFETVFQEQRPFFVEGSQIYQFSAGPGQLLYTRRIGADNPILGAAKLSGRTANGLSFGVLGATTGDDLRPARHYGVVRASQQLGAYSSAGGILTLFDGTASQGRRRSAVAGADWDLRFLDNRFGLEGFAAVTHRAQTLADADSEAGAAGKMWLRKRQGAWKGFVGVDVYSDHFNPNDVGQLPFSNTTAVLGSLEHEINDNRPFGPFQRASVSAFGVQQFTFRDGLHQGLSLNMDSRWVLRGFQVLEVGASIQNPFGGYDVYETRGLGPWARPFGVVLRGEYTTDERRSWEVEPEVSVGLNADGGRELGAGLRGNWSASDRLSLGANVEAELGRGVVAWSSNETFVRTENGWLVGRTAGGGGEPDDFVAFDDGGALAGILAGVAPIAPGRYLVPVFGARDTRSLDLTLRGTYTFRPDLSVQLYSQMFLAGGRFDEMRILRSREELAPFDAFPKRNEFAINSLQSNAVMRWEYRPGSTLYVVWTHGRSAEDRLDPLGPWGASPYARGFDEQLVDTFDIFPDNAFLIKLSYTFLN